MRLTRLTRVVSHLTNRIVSPVVPRLAKLATCGYLRIPLRVRRVVSLPPTLVWRILRWPSVRLFRACRWIWRVRFGKFTLATTLCATVVFFGYPFLPTVAQPIQGATSYLHSSSFQLEVIQDWGRYLPAQNSYQMSVEATATGPDALAPITWSGQKFVKIQPSPATRDDSGLHQTALVAAPPNQLVAIKVQGLGGATTYELDHPSPPPATRSAPLVQVTVQKTAYPPGCAFQASASTSEENLSVVYQWNSSPQMGHSVVTTATDYDDSVLDDYPERVTEWYLSPHSSASIWALGADDNDPTRPLGTSPRALLQCP